MTTKLRRQQPRRSLLETFLQLCSMTTPHGCESFCWPCLPKGKDGIDWLIDMNNNVHIYVPLILKGKKTDSRIMWTCHLDTADHAPTHVVFTRSKDKWGDEIIETNGKSILGADCKMGAAIMIRMIEEGVPGWYAFFAGEESGRIGSSALAKRIAKQRESKETKMPDICISLDRMDTGDIITRQSGRVCCSPTFALALASIFNKHPELHYNPCPNGSYTDSYSFVDLIPECTNISVGYAHQHTKWEEQNISHAQRLLDTILEHRDLFELLPADRNPLEKMAPAANQNYKFYSDDKDKRSDPTDRKSSGGTGTPPLASRTVSGKTSSTSSGGKAGMDKAHSSQLVSCGTTALQMVSNYHPQASETAGLPKQTKAERKREKRQRRAARKLKESADISKTGTTCPPPNEPKPSESKGPYPLACKTEVEVEQTVLEKPYLDYLAAVRTSEIVKPEAERSLTYPDWMRETWEFDSYDDYVERHKEAESKEDVSDGCTVDMFDEMQMQYEKGELDEEEEELFLMERLQQLKRGDTRGHEHGAVITWYECASCHLYDHCDVLDGCDEEKVYCKGCGDPVERQLMRYDADCKMYMPIGGDMTLILDPDVVDEGREQS